MAVVMGVMALAAHFVRRRQGFSPTRSGGAAAPNGNNPGTAGLLGGPRSRRARPEPPLDVVYRRALAKGAWVTLVEASGKRFLVGVTEQSVSLLAELPAGAAAAPAGANGNTLSEGDSPIAFGDEQSWAQTGRMPVSLRDAANEERPENAWKLAVDSLRERTVRR